MYFYEPFDPNESFRERRRRMRRRTRIRRAFAAAALLALGAGLALGATFISRGGSDPAATTSARAKPRPAASRVPALPRPPSEIRGVHVTMGLASIPGRLDRFVELRAYGLNTIELDVKDENGKIGFVEGTPALAQAIGAARPYYNGVKAATTVTQAGLYLIGRVVVFEDPTLTAARPDLAIKRADGSIWRTSNGLGWTNPYDRRVWKYNVEVAAAAAAAGFDEIQFDYVRFPSDGDVGGAVYPKARSEPKGVTIARFLEYASKRLRPLGVRISADLFGLAATRDLGVGQVPKRIASHVDAIYPMVYPSHYSKGEYDIVDPELFPGRTVANSLLDFRRQTKGMKVRLVPWLQDFSLDRTFGLIEVTDQIAAARRQHADGFMLWNPEGVYTRDALSGPSG